MAQASVSHSASIGRWRRWGSFFAVVLVVAILAAMVFVPLWGTRASQAKRDEVTQEVTPLRFSFDAYHLDVLRLSTEGRAYAATRSPGSRDRYFATLRSLQIGEADLVARGDAAGFAAQTARFVAEVHAYEDVLAAVVAAEDAADDFESFRLIEQEEEPKLVGIDAEAQILTAAIDERRAQLREQVLRIDDRERVAIGVAGALGLLAAGFLGWLIVTNSRLARQADTQRRRLDEVIADVPGIVWEAWGRPDAATQRIDFVSRYVEEMLGYSVKEWLSTPNFWLTIVHPNDREGAAARAAETFTGESTAANRFRWIAKDGRVVPVVAYSTPIFDERGAPIGMRGVTMDISEQAEAERARDRERARFASIIASIDYGVYQTDELGHLTYLNPAAEVMFGRALEDVQGRETHALFHQKRLDGTPLPQEECPIFQSTRRHTAYRGVEAFARQDGSLFPVEVGCATVVVDDQPTGTVVVFQDITERLKREQQKDDFVAFASHELRSPLTSVKGFSRWLAGRVESAPESFGEDERGAIATLVEESDRMESIIDLFLDLARLESDRLTMEMEPLDLKRLLNDECERLRLLYPDARCDAALPSDSLIAVLDNNRVRQVIGNLLDNAAKYGGAAAKVAVLVDVEQAWAVIRIKDNGPGIPLDDQPFVFNRYYRGREAAASSRRGLGVGLFITKQLVDRLGGKLSFISTPGSGTEFTVRLPLAVLEDDDPADAFPGSAIST